MGRLLKCLSDEPGRGGKRAVFIPYAQGGVASAFERGREGREPYCSRTVHEVGKRFDLCFFDGEEGKLLENNRYGKKRRGGKEG